MFSKKDRKKVHLSSFAGVARVGGVGGRLVLMGT